MNAKRGDLEKRDTERATSAFLHPRTQAACHPDLPSVAWHQTSWEGIESFATDASLERRTWMGIVPEIDQTSLLWATQRLTTFACFTERLYGTS
jgi:hypothetical protein